MRTVALYKIIDQILPIHLLFTAILTLFQKSYHKLFKGISFITGRGVILKLIILGPPGSGKGTISERLVKDFGLFHLSAGALLREEVQKGTTLGKEIKKYIEKGELLPNHFVVEMIKLEVGKKKKYILDGFPRSVDEAEEIEELGIDLVLYLDVSEKAVIERLGGRRVCEKGTHGYHLKYFPPKKLGVCDVDGTKLIQRVDDTPAVIKERFRVYNTMTKPVVNFYSRKGLLVRVDAAPMPERVYEKVKRLVKNI